NPERDAARAAEDAKVRALAARVRGIRRAISSSSDGSRSRRPETTFSGVSSSNQETTGLVMFLGFPILAAVTLATQSPEARPAQRRADPPAQPKSITATRAQQPPVIDGRDDDAVWRDAKPITEFQERRPSEGGEPKLPTEAKVAYDAGNLYVFMRSFDPHPDSIITVLARRDYFTPSDMVWLFLDS